MFFLLNGIFTFSRRNTAIILIPNLLRLFQKVKNIILKVNIVNFPVVKIFNKKKLNIHEGLTLCDSCPRV